MAARKNGGVFETPSGIPIVLENSALQKQISVKHEVHGRGCPSRL